MKGTSKCPVIVGTIFVGAARNRIFSALGRTVLLNFSLMSPGDLFDRHVRCEPWSALPQLRASCARLLGVYIKCKHVGRINTTRSGVLYSSGVDSTISYPIFGHLFCTS
ncbi:unnamed protein product [Sphacelaria rigidula]